MIAGDDPSATAEFAELSLPFVLAHLSADFSTASEDEIWTAATNAILDVCERASKIDPAKWTLRRYLKVAATRDLLNLLEHKKGRPNIESVTDPVELTRLPRIGKEDMPGLDEEISDVVARYEAQLPSRQDREILRLMLEGVRDEDAFADALGIDDLPKSERHVAVKRAKDRIKAKLRRAGYNVE